MRKCLKHHITWTLQSKHDKKVSLYKKDKWLFLWDPYMPKKNHAGALSNPRYNCSTTKMKLVIQSSSKKMLFPPKIWHFWVKLIIWFHASDFLACHSPSFSCLFVLGSYVFQNFSHIYVSILWFLTLDNFLELLFYFWTKTYHNNDYLILWG